MFIDEGFGRLDADTLNLVMEALDRLQSQGRRVGVISHVQDMTERIGTQIRVEPVGRGRAGLLYEDISAQGPFRLDSCTVVRPVWLKHHTRYRLTTA